MTRIPNSEHHSSGDNLVSWKNSGTEQNKVIEVSPQGNTKIKLEGNYYEWKSLSLLGEDGKSTPNRAFCWEAMRA
ncbi:hypothetical protein DEO72_LG7g1878 [Vigna unguiculata]|uniref:Uncharacterized protein n=1 Tax=Vigna unguiculata TaxID=3917 RepID=A0A4D6MHU1_VIGUN|nr:hypothetical protein DEO72_LG7g1878 [Vigna unguiculata]